MALRSLINEFKNHKDYKLISGLLIGIVGGGYGFVSFKDYQKLKVEYGDELYRKNELDKHIKSSKNKTYMQFNKFLIKLEENDLWNNSSKFNKERDKILIDASNIIDSSFSVVNIKEKQTNELKSTWNQSFENSTWLCKILFFSQNNSIQTINSKNDKNIKLLSNIQDSIYEMAKNIYKKSIFPELSDENFFEHHSFIALPDNHGSEPYYLINDGCHLTAKTRKLYGEPVNKYGSEFNTNIPSLLRRIVEIDKFQIQSSMVNPSSTNLQKNLKIEKINLILPKIICKYENIPTISLLKDMIYNHKPIDLIDLENKNILLKYINDLYECDEKDIKPFSFYRVIRVFG